MSDAPAAPRPRIGDETVVVTGAASFSAFGRGVDALLAAAQSGTPGFAPVDRFDVAGRRVRVAAIAAGDPVLSDEIVAAVTEACDIAGLSTAEQAGTDLLIALHGDPDLARAGDVERAAHSAGAYATRVALAAGLSGTARAYTSACVASSTAVADAASVVSHGRAERVVVAAGYLVESDQFAIFDAGRALAVDGQVRPFSAGRKGMLLGDGVGAVVVESASAARRRGATALGRVCGWGRAGDAYHVVAPRPDGAGLARAIGTALHRAGIGPEFLGYVNAHGSGTAGSDAAETVALRRALGEAADTTPVSSTKSVHGQALEASGLLEFIITLGTLSAGKLPVNAGFLGPDETCALDVVTEPRAGTPRYAMTVNSAFGGAHTALVVGAP